MMQHEYQDIQSAPVQRTWQKTHVREAIFFACLVLLVALSVALCLGIYQLLPSV